jgi:hypothetical protein
MAVGRRRFAYRLSTLLGLRKRGFFIPYRYADQVPDRSERATYEALEVLFRAAEPTFQGVIEAINACADALHAIGREPPPEPRWNQDWFPRLDAAAAYVFVRAGGPARIIEVGSGHSTRFMTRAIRDGGITSHVTTIDPAPRAEIEGTGAMLIRQTAQKAGLATFASLAAGDILFIDSSHILLPGTDVDILFNHVLPALPAGVMVHVHDVFLPDDYPPEWEWRGYNEQLGVAALVQSRGYRLLWSSHYATTRMALAIATSVAGGLELMPGAHESSLWMVKT